MVAYRFKTGVFSLIDLEAADNESWEQVAARMGFDSSAVCHFGGPDANGHFSVYVYSRTGASKNTSYRYLVNVAFEDGSIEHLFCSAMPDLLQLLPLLAPLVRLNPAERGKHLRTLVGGAVIESP